MRDHPECTQEAEKVLKAKFYNRLVSFNDINLFLEKYIRRFHRLIDIIKGNIIYYNIFGLYDDRVSQAKRSLQELNSNRIVEKDPKKKAIADAKYKSIADSLKSSRIALEKPLNDAGDSSITWLETEIALLKGKNEKTREEKNCLNRSVDYLANIFSYKKEKARGKDLKAYDLYDVKFKLYDSLHDTFK
jgi:hypothetical protein